MGLGLDEINIKVGQWASTELHELHEINIKDGQWASTLTKFTCSGTYPCTPLSVASGVCGG